MRVAVVVLLAVCVAAKTVEETKVAAAKRDEVVCNGGSHHYCYNENCEVYCHDGSSRKIHCPGNHIYSQSYFTAGYRRTRVYCDPDAGKKIWQQIFQTQRRITNSFPFNPFGGFFPWFFSGR